MPFVNTLFIASEGVSTANSLTVAPNTSRHQRKNAVPMPRLRQPRRMKMCASLGGSPRLLSISHGGATFSNVSVYPIASPSARGTASRQFPHPRVLGGKRRRQRLECGIVERGHLAHRKARG